MIIPSIIATLLIVTSVNSTADTNTINREIYDNQIYSNYDPIIEEDTILLPVKSVLEKLNFKVYWDEKTRSILGIKGTDRIKLFPDLSIAIRNMEIIELDYDIQVINGSTYMPIEFFRGVIGINIDDLVEYDPIDNPYDSNLLHQLVSETDCDDAILEFRTEKNRRRNGLQKLEGKYFDIYYPDTETANEVAAFLEPHMDMVYMMLTDLYRKQAPTEVHLIHENSYGNINEGRIRRTERVTFIYLDSNFEFIGDKLDELIHEVGHCFFMDTNITYVYDDKWRMMIEESLCQTIVSLYEENMYDEEMRAYSFFDLYHAVDELNYFRGKKDKNATSTYMTITQAANTLENRYKDGEARHTGIAFWIYLYQEYGFDKLKEIISTFDNGSSYKERIVEVYGKSIEELSNETIEAVKKAKPNQW